MISEGGEVAIVKEESVEQVSESAEGGEQKGVPTEDGTQVKKNKKRVSWAEEAHLKQVFYFELDETERGTILLAGFRLVSMLCCVVFTESERVKYQCVATT